MSYQEKFYEVDPLFRDFYNKWNRPIADQPFEYFGKAISPVVHNVRGDAQQWFERVILTSSADPVYKGQVLMERLGSMLRSQRVAYGDWIDAVTQFQANTGV